MAPMKRSAANRKRADPVQSRCKLIRRGIESSESCPGNVKKILSSTSNFSVGTLKADRHPFNERLVAMIGEVLVAEGARLTKDVEDKDKAFAELSPARTSREEAVEAAKAAAAEKAEAFDAAKKAVSETSAPLKEASAALKEAEKAQKVGDAESEPVARKKAELEEVQKESLGPLLDGSCEDDAKMKMIKTVLEAGKSYNFDASLLPSAEQSLEKSVADRGAFDATCLEQLQTAFGTAVAGLDEQLAAAAPGKAERAAAVEAARAAKEAVQAQQADLKDKAQAAKDAKAAADAVQKEAVQSLENFMPELKQAGDALDNAKSALKEFQEGPSQSFNELKDLKEDDFKEPEPEEAVSGSPEKKARTSEGDGATQ